MLRTPSLWHPSMEHTQLGPCMRIPLQPGAWKPFGFVEMCAHILEHPGAILVCLEQAAAILEASCKPGSRQKKKKKLGGWGGISGLRPLGW